MKNRALPTPLLSLLAALVLAGCAAAPPIAPVVDVPAQFKEAPASWKAAEPAEAQARGEWWRAFRDPALDALIEQASTANADLAAAAARVKQARALAGVEAAARVPQLQAGFGAERAGTGAGVQRNAFTGLIGASYELDLFGRVAASVDAATADADRSEALHRSVLLALKADVAQTYFRLRGADAERALLQRTAALREENVRINQRRFELGDVGELDVVRARTELALTRSDLHALERQRAQLEHALATLLGRPAPAFALDASPLAQAAFLPAIPAGLPSALLERRPDIAAAQYAMMAAQSRVGVARSALFPAIRLTAAGGVESADLSELLRWSSRSWALGALAALPLLDGGRNRAVIARQQAVLEEAGEQYRGQVLRAFAEVEDNLVGVRTLASQIDALDEALASARRSVELAESLYRAGRGSYLELLDAQRNLAAAERSAVQLRSARAVSTVALVRALGGGWQ
ncbi:MAG TPA: efflux transporter outer membrane subunit [Noviherbaspirillum sp.]|nr:efflux transporter outer membrane subunit [Noviherbaspirillum sp.]